MHDLDAIVSQTGPGAFIGRDESAGLTALTERVNKSGGIAGRPIKLVTGEGQMDDEITRATYTTLAEALEPNLYPSTAAIENVYQEGIRQDDDARRINPMALWDLHVIRRLDDMGFARGLS